MITIDIPIYAIINSIPPMVSMAGKIFFILMLLVVIGLFLFTIIAAGGP